MHLEEVIFMNKRVLGYVRALIILILDGGLIQYYLHDWRITVMAIGCITLYAFYLGECFATLRVGGVRLDKLDALNKSKLSQGYEILKKQYSRIYGKDLNLKVYLIPEDSFNAYAFGIKKIGITSDALSSLDATSVAGVLAHEVGHVIGLDVVVKRLLFANLFGLSIILLISQMIWWVIALLTCIGIAWLFNSCLGIYISAGLFKGLTKISKGIFGVIISLAQSFISLIDRSREYAADSFACDLGFSSQLAFVLDRYVGETPPARCISDLLYATHPKTVKRIARIEKKMEKKRMKIICKKS